MGYRSQVSMAIEKKAFQKHVKESKEYFRDCDDIQENEHNYLFRWEHVKWYDDYEDVSGVMAVLERIDDDEDLNDADYYGFIRIGEGTGDIETIGEPYAFGLYAVQLIEHDFKGKAIPAKEFLVSNSVEFIKEE